MSRGQGQKVNRKQLADVFGISLPTVDAWVRSGCPYDQKGERGREWIFDTADVMRWRERQARDDAGGEDTQDEARLKRRKLVAETKSAEIDLLVKQGALAPIEQMERAWSRMAVEVQNNMRGPLIVRVVRQLLGETDERTFKRVLLSEVDSILDALANVDPTVDDMGDDEDGADADG